VPVGLVAFIRDVAEKVHPRHTIGAANEVGVSYRPEGLANVRGVCDISMRREEDSPESRSISRISKV
jgi:hypothetical protein